jgi:hypothetical protein
MNLLTECSKTLKECKEWFICESIIYHDKLLEKDIPYVGIEELGEGNASLVMISIDKAGDDNYTDIAPDMEKISKELEEAKNFGVIDTNEINTTGLAIYFNADKLLEELNKGATK